ncbi:Signal transduction histidine kinase, nitrate/nitrite-specific [Alteromonas mediterranea 615]|uniref:Signal transduction histidine kinase, nitrate/nitrite-specific n=1 Tax=Alteromonas mediterranea 615 TaxID=1300253 RepID=S5AHW7_9ALTE|nr:Signal transduction histidine kinase, nitrate/nitrite-specific [Alteromonas mediterranea 615]
MQPIKNFIHSTVFKIAALMFSVSFLAIVSMFTTVFMSDGAQFDAQAVNVAGR